MDDQVGSKNDTFGKHYKLRGRDTGYAFDGNYLFVQKIEN